ncbi:MAG TPA: hypothetical protein ENN84_02910 [Candidatus Marinimicrobia bacterium]|nr:hypothetical protein [Candidatus Neomarinimicrobiota bacterium]
MSENNSILERQRTMYALVESYAQSNQTRRDFCAAHSLPLSTFGYWQRKYRQQALRGFAPVAVIPEKEEQGHQIRIALPGGLILKLEW